MIDEQKNVERAEDRRSELNALLSVGDLPRDCSGAPCPKCNGYADRVDATKNEIAKYQTCGRSYACCIDAFVCRLCGERFIGHLDSPEME